MKSSEIEATLNRVSISFLSLFLRVCTMRVYARMRMCECLHVSDLCLSSFVTVVSVSEAMILNYNALWE
jgi:hypothetical protein